MVQDSKVPVCWMMQDFKESKIVVVAVGGAWDTSPGVLGQALGQGGGAGNCREAVLQRHPRFPAAGPEYGSGRSGTDL